MSVHNNFDNQLLDCIKESDAVLGGLVKPLTYAYVDGLLNTVEYYLRELKENQQLSTKNKNQFVSTLTFYQAGLYQLIDTLDKPYRKLKI